MQLLPLIIIAVVAGVVLYQLYAVLGRRVGRQPEDVPQPAGSARRADGEPYPPVKDEAPPQPSGVVAIRARDPSFDIAKFLAGARQAYEMIVAAYASGDRQTLQRLVSATVMDGFEKAMAAREAKGVTESVEFSQPPRSDLENAEVKDDIARARVRFLAEFHSRTKGPDGEHAGERRSAEVWTFERRLSSRDPNWTLVRVDAAEA
ncbi:MAG TPA: TIM44-related membrane protein TimA [Caulobacteraceae bacterium]|nr:TIM44-related membrane protein TimA [Caulobacteraceae bacterium]